MRRPHSPFGELGATLIAPFVRAAIAMGALYGFAAQSALAQEVKPGAPAAPSKDAAPPPAPKPAEPAKPAPAAAAPAAPTQAAPPAPAQPAPAAEPAQTTPPQTAPDSGAAAPANPPAPATEAPAPARPKAAEPESPGHPQPLAANVSVESWGWGKEPAWASLSSLRAHKGFSIRVGAGLGYAHASRKLTSGTEKLGGLAGSLTLDIGTSVIENLIVYGRLNGVAFNHAWSSDTEHINGAYFLSLGAGARYYFMPENWYAGATLSLAGIRVTNDEIDAQNAHPGFGFDLEAGHDWWIGSHYDQRSIGLGLRFSYETCSTSASAMPRGKSWNGYAAMAVFAVGYN